MITQIPNFKSFVANERKVYAYVALSMLVVFVYKYVDSQNEQIEYYKAKVDKCDKENIKLNEKIQYILEKQQELTNKKKTIESL